MMIMDLFHNALNHECITQTYLTDEEFQKVFGKTVKEFKALPEWKKKDLKKKVDLF